MDPLSLVCTSFGLIFYPDFMMDGLIPAARSISNPDHAFLFHQLAALYGYLALILAVVPRMTSDIRLWKVVVGGTLLVDLSLLASAYVSLRHQGRLDFAAWRWQDWGWVSYNSGVAIIRSLFLAGVGVTSGIKGKRA